MYFHYLKKIMNFWIKVSERVSLNFENRSTVCDGNPLSN